MKYQIINRKDFLAKLTTLKGCTKEFVRIYKLFMQNKANFTRFSPENDDLTKNKPNLSQNKPNSKPIYRKAKNDAKHVFTKDYDERSGYGPKKNKPNSNPIFQLTHMLNLVASRTIVS